MPYHRENFKGVQCFFSKFFLYFSGFFKVSICSCNCRVYLEAGIGLIRNHELGFKNVICGVS
jgi:hypothetical protein